MPKVKVKFTPGMYARPSGKRATPSSAPGAHADAGPRPPATPPDALAAPATPPLQAPDPGDHVVVQHEIEADGCYQQQIKQGAHGEVIAIDDDGDAQIKFDGKNLYVMRRNLAKLKRLPKGLSDTDLAGAEARTLANLMSAAIATRKDAEKEYHDAEQAALMNLTVASVENRETPRPPEAPPPKVQEVMKAEREIGEFEAGYWAGVAETSHKRSARLLAKEMRGKVLMSGPSPKALKVAHGPAPPAATPPPHLLAAAAAERDAQNKAMEETRRAAARRPLAKWINEEKKTILTKLDKPSRPKPPAYVPPWKRAEEGAVKSEEEDADEEKAEEEDPLFVEPPVGTLLKRFVKVTAKKELDF